jgi:hypothetical protein
LKLKLKCQHYGVHKSMLSVLYSHFYVQTYGRSTSNDHRHDIRFNIHIFITLSPQKRSKHRHRKQMTMIQCVHIMRRRKSSDNMCQNGLKKSAMCKCALNNYVKKELK